MPCVPPSPSHLTTPRLAGQPHLHRTLAGKASPTSALRRGPSWKSGQYSCRPLPLPFFAGAPVPTSPPEQVSRSPTPSLSPDPLAVSSLTWFLKHLLPPGSHLAGCPSSGSSACLSCLCSLPTSGPTPRPLAVSQRPHPFPWIPVWPTASDTQSPPKPGVQPPAPVSHRHLQLNVARRDALCLTIKFTHLSWHIPGEPRSAGITGIPLSLTFRGCPFWGLRSPPS